VYESVSAIALSLIADSRLIVATAASPPPLPTCRQGGQSAPVSDSGGSTKLKGDADEALDALSDLARGIYSIEGLCLRHVHGSGPRPSISLGTPAA